MFTTNILIHVESDTAIKVADPRKGRWITLTSSPDQTSVTLFFPEENKLMLAITDELMQAINSIRDQVTRPTLTSLHGGMSREDPNPDDGAR